VQRSLITWHIEGSNPLPGQAGSTQVSLLPGKKVKKKRNTFISVKGRKKVMRRTLLFFTLVDWFKNSVILLSPLIVVIISKTSTTSSFHGCKYLSKKQLRLKLKKIENSYHADELVSASVLFPLLLLVTLDFVVVLFRKLPHPLKLYDNHISMHLERVVLVINLGMTMDRVRVGYSNYIFVKKEAASRNSYPYMRVKIHTRIHIHRVPV
jgi:hypothetical protein